jgi:proteasome assembly chaperone (PAC2) family protein
MNSTETPLNARRTLIEKALDEIAGIALDGKARGSGYIFYANEAREVLEGLRRAVLAEAERALRERAAKLNKTDYSREECVAIGLTEAADLLAGMRGDE